MADTEIIDIVDEKNNIVGSASVTEAHDKKLIHRVAGVFVFDVDGCLYLQTGNKYGKLDLSVGGHVKQGEAYEDAAKREMLEEIGLDVPILQVATFLPTNARRGHYWRLFTATAPNSWKFTKTKEVKSLEKMEVGAIKELIKNKPDLFTHGFLNTFTELVRVQKL
jgi:8-oxo-dGTP pyrophosphatase MutT (NUDIX family)